jgi:hypothetical protein
LAVPGALGIDRVRTAAATAAAAALTGQNPSDSPVFGPSRRRGRYWEDYDEGTTLRERLYGPGHPRVRDDHPAARYRRAPLAG